MAERLLQVDFLTDREKDILKMRLGMEGYPNCTLQEIGDKYSISRERVRQIGTGIVYRIKKNMPEETLVANNLFVKAWIPRYLIKKQQTAHRKAAIRRKKAIIRNKYKNLIGLIVEFSRTGKGKERIDRLFKKLRLSYRRNKSLFEPYLVEELKRWRKQYMGIKRAGIRPLLPEGESRSEAPARRRREAEKRSSITEGIIDQGEIS